VTESSSGIESGRLSEIADVVRKAKQRGFSRRDRREVVISEIGQKSLDKEPAEVRETAINKYWNLKIGSPNMPVLIIAPHAKKAGEGEILGHLRDKFPESTRKKLLELTKQWLEVERDQGTHKIIERRSSNNEIFTAIKLLANRLDSSTDSLAETIAKESNSTLAIAKKSRMWADANRKPFSHKPQGVGQQKRFIQAREYPTSIRASWYWAAQKIIERTVGLDDDKKPIKPFLQIVIHGMKDRISEDGEDNYDIVIGGGDIKKDEEKKLANDKVINWLTETLIRKVNEQKGFPNGFKVAIDRKGKETVEVFQIKNGKVEKKEIKRIGERLSGADLGLEYFRTGCNFEVETLEGNQRVLKFPGLGTNFNTIQLEVSRNIRENPEFRAVFTQALGELSVEFGENFL